MTEAGLYDLKAALEICFEANAYDTDRPQETLYPID